MIELIIMPVIGISLASGVPSLLRVRTAEREASAIESVQTINEAQANYAASCGGGFLRRRWPTLRRHQSALLMFLSGLS